MKEYSYKSLGLNVKVEGPESIEEYNQLANSKGTPRENPVLEDALNEQVYRGALATFRSRLAEALEDETGISRNTRTVAAKDGSEKEVFDETEARYFERVKATTGRATESFQALADAIDDLKVDPSQKERAAATPSIGKQIRARVEAILAKGEDAARTVAERMGADLGRPVAPTLEGLASAVKEIKKRREAEIAAALDKQFEL